MSPYHAAFAKPTQRSFDRPLAHGRQTGSIVCLLEKDTREKIPDFHIAFQYECDILYFHEQQT